MTSSAQHRFPNFMITLYLKIADMLCSAAAIFQFLANDYCYTSFFYLTHIYYIFLCCIVFQLFKAAFFFSDI